MYINFSTGNSLLDESIENYLMHGLDPGGFLTAVLCNDLFLASGRADYHNRERLAEIAQTVYLNMPGWSFGNQQLVKDWIKDKDGRRSAYSLQKEKEYTWRSLKGTVREKDTFTPF
jgi:hypothetical protein